MCDETTAGLSARNLVCKPNASPDAGRASTPRKRIRRRVPRSEKQREVSRRNLANINAARNNSPATQFKRGNVAPLTHGLRVPDDRLDSQIEKLPPEFRAMFSEVRALMEADIRDEGVRRIEDVPVRRRDEMEIRWRLRRRLQQCDYYIEKHGLFDGKGTLRERVLGKMIALAGTITRIDTLLGLERKERDILDLPAGEYAEHAAHQTDDTNTITHTQTTTEDSDEEGR